MGRVVYPPYGEIGPAGNPAGGRSSRNGRFFVGPIARSGHLLKVANGFVARVANQPYKEDSAA